MAITRKDKELIIEKLKKAFTENSTVAFVGFNGLGVDDTVRMRDALRDKGVGYTVARKTLIKKAAEESGFEGSLPSLDGEVAMAYGEETYPASEVYSFQKELEGKVSLLGGVFENSFLDKEGIMQIAQIPPLDTLRGMFVNIINSPIQRFAIAMGEIAKAKS